MTHTCLEVSTPFSTMFQAIFTPFIVVSFDAFPSHVLEFFRVFSVTFRCIVVSLFVTLVGMSLRERFHDAASALILIRSTVNLQCYSQFLCLAGDALAPAALEVQLRDVVWSDEFFLLREPPNHHEDVNTGGEIWISTQGTPRARP